MTEFTHAEHTYMARAIELAKKAWYTTSPNPRVGCVLVKNNEIIAEGFHQKAGEPHAEVHALRQAGDNAKGATAFVTLEPCSHTGKTPPCADALIAAGVEEVIAAPKVKRVVHLMPFFQIGVALFLGWLLFYLVAGTLADIPDEFHDGTIWE